MSRLSLADLKDAQMAALLWVKILPTQLIKLFSGNYLIPTPIKAQRPTFLFVVKASIPQKSSIGYIASAMSQNTDHADPLNSTVSTYCQVVRFVIRIWENSHP